MSQAAVDKILDFTFVPIMDANNHLSYFQLNLYQGLGVYRNNIAPFAFNVNVDAITWAIAGEVFNYVVGQGQGTGPGILSTIVSSDGSQKGFTRREKTVKVAAVQQQTQLDARILAYVNQNQGVVLNINAEMMQGKSPVPGEVNIGDIVNVNLSIPLPSNPKVPSFVNFVGTAQITAINVEVDKDGHEIFTPTLMYTM
jgi:hypothetical protein